MNNLPIQTYETVVQQRDELEKKLADVVAESNAIKDAAKSLLSEASIVYSKYNETQQPDNDLVDMQTLHELQVAMSETPVTDAFTRELMARGVEAFAVMIGTPQPDSVRDDFFESLCKQFEKSANDFASDIRKGINDAQ